MSLNHPDLDRWLAHEDRLIVEVTWRPLLGDRFQPTNFPNLGAAEYTAHGETTVVVDSPQSMANRLEALSWDDAKLAPRGPWQSLPYVEVRSAATNDFLTSSRLEAHRLNGAWLRDSKTSDNVEWPTYLNQAMGLSPDRPMEWRRVCQAVYELDPLTLMHGGFFSDKRIHGQPKIARAITGTMDAKGARSVTSGGAKKDSVGAKNELTGGSAEGYGSILYPRVEYIADDIRSMFVLDIEQIRSYGLGTEATENLFLLGVWEIAEYVSKPRRHRTFCDLMADGVAVVGAGTLPDAADVTALIVQRVPQRVAEPLVLRHTVKPRNKKEANQQSDQEND